MAQADDCGDAITDDLLLWHGQCAAVRSPHTAPRGNVVIGSPELDQSPVRVAVSPCPQPVAVQFVHDRPLPSTKLASASPPWPHASMPGVPSRKLPTARSQVNGATEPSVPVLARCTHAPDRPPTSERRRGAPLPGVAEGPRARFVPPTRLNLSPWPSNMEFFGSRHEGALLDRPGASRPRCRFRRETRRPCVPSCRGVSGRSLVWQA